MVNLYCGVNVGLDRSIPCPVFWWPGFTEQKSNAHAVVTVKSISLHDSGWFRKLFVFMERETGIEPATFSLGRWT
jgi:hypothetical protein